MFDKWIARIIKLEATVKKFDELHRQLEDARLEIIKLECAVATLTHPDPIDPYRVLLSDRLVTAIRNKQQAEDWARRHTLGETN